MIKIVNDILTIVGLLVVAQVVSILIISAISYLLRLFTRPSGVDSNNDTNQRQSCIYIPNYIKKLGSMIPQFTNKTIVKTSHRVPYLNNCEQQPLVKNIPDVINSPITKLEESPSNQTSHIDNLPQGKEGNQPNANSTVLR